MNKYLQRVSILLFVIAFPFHSKADEVEGLQFIVQHYPLKPVSANKAPIFDLNQTNEFKLAAMFLLNFYKTFISNQGKPACNFYPTCSQYAGQAIKKHGIIIGMIMGSDRLQRCNGQGYGYYPVHKQSGKLYDPLE